MSELKRATEKLKEDSHLSQAVKHEKMAKKEVIESEKHKQMGLEPGKEPHQHFGEAEHHLAEAEKHHGEAIKHKGIADIHAVSAEQKGAGLTKGVKTGRVKEGIEGHGAGIPAGTTGTTTATGPYVEPVYEEGKPKVLTGHYAEPGHELGEPKLVTTKPAEPIHEMGAPKLVTTKPAEPMHGTGEGKVVTEKYVEKEKVLGEPTKKMPEGH